LLANGGWAFVSYRPDRLAAPVMAALDCCIVSHLSDPEAAQAVRQRFNIPNMSLADVPRGHVWLWSQNLVRLRPGTRRAAHIRHLHKYLHSPLPAHKRFRFRDAHAFLNLEAANLFEFVQIIPSLPLESLAYHQARGDFAAWAEGALGDGELAAHLRKLANRGLEGEILREALVQRAAAYYAELCAQE